MPSEQSEPRELTPIQRFWGDNPNFKDFSPHAVPADTVLESEVEEVEEVLTPAPKGSPAPESVTFSESQPTDAPPRSETPALPSNVLPTELLEAAVKESGKDSDEIEDDPQTQKTTTPSQDPSSPSSSSETSPGSNEPPAEVKPPAVASPPAVPTTPK
jgi:hypothetical protein